MSRKWQPTPVFLPGQSHGQRLQRDGAVLTKQQQNSVANKNIIYSEIIIGLQKKLQNSIYGYFLNVLHPTSSVNTDILQSMI